jgi:hypothetical protein
MKILNFSTFKNLEIAIDSKFNKKILQIILISFLGCFTRSLNHAWR